MLERLGAQIEFFSPLDDETLPEVDGLIIGGGFPEMFASQLERNKKIRTEIFHAAADGLPIFAECGGFMYLMNRLIDFDGRAFDMCGVFDGCATMTRRLQRVGYVTAELASDCVVGRQGQTFHAHEFRYSVTDVEQNLFDCERLRDDSNFTAGVAVGNVAASYLHVHFAGCPNVAKNFVDACVNRRLKRNSS